MAQQIQTAIFAGGCFWCTEAIYADLRGIISVTPGYTGGELPDPTYEQVCSGETGHAEAIKIEFDPTIISYRDLLEVFFSTHNPTTLNRQGNDVGTQYRSTVFYVDDAQKTEAEKIIAELTEQKVFSGAIIVTTIEPAAKFYAAEDYHKNYYARHPDQAYCQAVIEPKLKKFRETYARLLSNSPVL
ncbi:MAG: peptide-methionine (S)-S-oxide reductase MsrA [Candidatus Magasanikbacteria bacterium]|nr:peptide-methionine (S)-S-oxide reductase MsrA [Candidatus Magasanikbacteria bacterium]